MVSKASKKSRTGSVQHDVQKCVASLTKNLKKVEKKMKDRTVQLPKQYKKVAAVKKNEQIMSDTTLGQSECEELMNRLSKDDTNA